MIARNYRMRVGEIDLVMRDGDACVFVEVRFRTRDDFGSPESTVDAAKRRRLIKAANRFLASRDDLADFPCRFDVVSVTRRNYLHRYQWIKDAFES